MILDKNIQKEGLHMGLKGFIDNYKRRSKELDEIYENAVRKAYVESSGKEWSKDKYEKILSQYYKKYGEQVFSKSVLLELEKKTGLSRDYIRKDLKKIL